MKTFNTHEFFCSFDSKPMTAKELSKAIEIKIMQNINVLPVELTIADMFNIGVKLGYIVEDENGKLFVGKPFMSESIGKSHPDYKE